ncbi:phage protein [Streptococcus pneumoniae]|nr:phage protein [Streptococcus pneumoniae]
MNKDKVYLEGYVIGHAADTLGYKGLMVQLENLDIVEIDKNLVCRDINGPQKVTVPQFVADWIEKADKKISLRDLMSNSYMNFEVNGWFGELDKDGAFKNQETFARAWLDGYTVEKEKRYTVKMKNLRALFCYLAYIPDEGYWTFMASGGESIVIKHTRKELEEAGFGEVFNSPLFEVEEVTE